MIKASKAREITEKYIMTAITDKIKEAASLGYSSIEWLSKQSFVFEEHIKSWGYDIVYDEKKEMYLISWR